MADGSQDRLAQLDGVRQRPGGVQAVERACRLLMEVIRSSEPPSVGELSRRTGRHQSTASRLLASLQRHGFVERDAARGPVRISAALVGQITRRSSRHALLDAARPVPENIGRITSETGPDTHALTRVNNVIAVLNYVITARPSLLNFMIADTIG